MFDRWSKFRIKIGIEYNEKKGGLVWVWVYLGAPFDVDEFVA
jgi:hypothetical protein